MSNFFHYPKKSELFNIYEVTNLDSGFYRAPLTEVQGKAFLMPYKNKFVVLPLVCCSLPLTENSTFTLPCLFLFL